MAVAERKSGAGELQQGPNTTRLKAPEGREAAGAAGLERARVKRREIGRLKADARARRADLATLLEDPQAAEVKILTVLRMIPGTDLEAALDALLVCRINGARGCGELSPSERSALREAMAGGAVRCAASRSAKRAPRSDRDLDRILAAARLRAPEVELAPSEFAAARAGLEADPLLLRMVDRLVDAVRLYADRDDGGVRARIVAEQWIRYRNYWEKVESGEYPPPALRGPALLE